MNSITAFNRKPLHNGEIITFYTRVLETVPATGLPASVLSPRNVLQTILQDMEGSHVAPGGSPLSAMAQELDAARDEQFSGLVLLCRAQAKHKEETRRRAAETLLARISDYGTIAEFTLQPAADESADISSLLRNIRESSELTNAATALGANDFLDELGRLNAEFERTYLTRSAGRAGNNRPSLEQLRPQADQAYNTLCRKINSYNETEEGADPWPGLINRLNDVIGGMRQVLDARRGRAASGNDAPPTGA